KARFQLHGHGLAAGFRTLKGHLLPWPSDASPASHGQALSERTLILTEECLPSRRHSCKSRSMADAGSEASTPVVGESRARRNRRPLAWRWGRRIAFIAIIVAMLPVGLTLVYAIPGTRPVSTLMLS